MSLHVEVLSDALTVGPVVVAPGGERAAAIHVLAVPVDPLRLDHPVEVVDEPGTRGGIPEVKDVSHGGIGPRQQPLPTHGGEPGMRQAHHHQIEVARPRPLAVHHVEAIAPFLGLADAGHGDVVVVLVEDAHGRSRRRRQDGADQVEQPAAKRRTAAQVARSQRRHEAARSERIRVLEKRFLEFASQVRDWHDVT